MEQSTKHRLTVTFHGLCFFARLSDTEGGQPVEHTTHVLCHPEDGAHIPVLAVPITMVDLKAMSDLGDRQWLPDLVGHDSAGEEIGYWNLRGCMISFGAVEEDPRWDDAVRGFRLKTFHPTGMLKTLSKCLACVFPPGKPLTEHGTLATLLGGTLEFITPPRISVRVAHKGGQDDAKSYSSAVSWATSFLAGTRPAELKKTIQTVQDGKSTTVETKLLLKMDVDISLRLTNVARIPAPEGLEHFKHYYCFFELASDDHQIKLSRAQRATDDLFRRFDINVYDCVPPADGGG